MSTRGRNIVDCLPDLFTRNAARVGDFLAVQNLRHGGRACHRRHTPSCLECSLLDHAIADAQRKLQHISTGRILDAGTMGRVRQIPRGTRMLEMV